MGKRNKRQTKKLVKPERVFLTAERIYEASLVINTDMHRNKKFNLLIPLVVNGSLALEQYLKCIYCINNNGELPIDERGRGIHKVKDLLAKISSEQQVEIRELFYSDIPIPSTFPNYNKLFGDTVDKISDAFVKWRYAYEYEADELPDIQFLDTVLRATRYIAEGLLYPDEVVAE